MDISILNDGEVVLLIQVSGEESAERVLNACKSVLPEAYLERCMFEKPSKAKFEIVKELVITEDTIEFKGAVAFVGKIPEIQQIIASISYEFSRNLYVINGTQESSFFRSIKVFIKDGHGKEYWMFSLHPGIGDVSDVKVANVLNDYIREIPYSVRVELSKEISEDKDVKSRSLFINADNNINPTIMAVSNIRSMEVEATLKNIFESRGISTINSPTLWINIK